MSSSLASHEEMVAIIGFGLMGAQIAQVFAQSGYDVACYDSNAGQIQRGLDLISQGRYGLKVSKEKGKLKEGEESLILGRIHPKNSIEEACEGASLILEAAVEDVEIKRKIFQKASFVTSGILASNTSTISISKIGERLDRMVRSRLLGLHFFNPPQVMKLVEIVRTDETSPDIVLKVEEISKAIGKVPISILDIPGFVANRIGLSVFAEASYLLEKQVANVRDIDLAMRLGYGYPLGPFELGDLVGLDSRLRNMQALFEETGDHKFNPPQILKKLVSEGFLGDPATKKGSKGGYYEFFGLNRIRKDQEEVTKKQ